jgi:hypothetical protein
MTEQTTLNAVDRVEVLTVIDNVMDALLRSTDVAKRMEAAGRERLPYDRCRMRWTSGPFPR